MCSIVRQDLFSSQYNTQVLYFVSEVQINHLLLNFRQKCKMSQCIERDTNVLMLHLNNILLLTTTLWTIHLSLWSCHKVPIVQLFPCSLHRSHKVLLSWIAFYCFDWEAATDFGHFYSCGARSGKKRTRRHIFDAFPRCREAKNPGVVQKRECGSSLRKVKASFGTCCSRSQSSMWLSCFGLKVLFPTLPSMTVIVLNIFVMLF